MNAKQWWVCDECNTMYEEQQEAEDCCQKNDENEPEEK